MRDLFQPTFSGRLRLFFVVIVIVPMIAVMLVLFRLVAETNTGRQDARLGEAQRGALGLFDDARRRAADAAHALVKDQRLASAIQNRDGAAIQARLSELARAEQAVQARLAIDAVGRFETGTPPSVAPVSSPVANSVNRMVGTLTLSVMSADEYVRTVGRLLDVEAVVAAGDGALASTLPAAQDVRLPERGSATIDGRDFRATSFTGPAFDGGRDTISLLAQDTSDSLLSASTLIVVGVALAFLALALAFAVTVSRMLQAEVQRLLVAAQRLGRGDFSIEVPAAGNDEFSALGREFNSMARQLETRLEELQRERTRLQEAIRRVGESFARGLDRVGLLEIVVQTAVDGVGAACGRATMRRAPDAPLREVSRMGEPKAYERALHAAEAAAMDAGQIAEIQLGGASALAAPLGATEDGDRVVGLVSVARGDRPFNSGERELFSYLTNQAAVSVENVGLHETVQRQAVTDELTGLFNHRRFQEVITMEVERARRFDHEMGLIMLDLDNFKRVNDTYGHMQGDLVLREVARVLRQSSREIDEPARYGGEEMAVALPQTDLEGAFQFAERVRRRIEALELPLVDGDGVLRVTASFGAASLARAGGGDKDALVAAADAALYRAKRSGKNRTVKAE